MKLVDPSATLLLESFAEHVAKWKRADGGCPCGEEACGSWMLPDGTYEYIPDWLGSMNAVLPWLEKYAWGVRSCGMTGSTHGYPHCMFWVIMDGQEYQGNVFHGDSITMSLPRAAVICLLRAHGVEVEFTK